MLHKLVIILALLFSLGLPAEAKLNNTIVQQEQELGKPLSVSKMKTGERLETREFSLIRTLSVYDEAGTVKTEIVIGRNGPTTIESAMGVILVLSDGPPGELLEVTKFVDPKTGIGSALLQFEKCDAAINLVTPELVRAVMVARKGMLSLSGGKKDDPSRYIYNDN